MSTFPKGSAVFINSIEAIKRGINSSNLLVQTNNTTTSSNNFTVHKFGFQLGLSSGVLRQDIWSVGGEYPNFASGAATVSSDDVNDVIGGTGAEIVVLNYLDEDGYEITEVLELNGLTPVNVSRNMKAFNRGYVLGGQSAVGNIRVYVGANVVGEIPIGSNQTQQAIYTVPSGFFGFISRVNIEANNNSNVRMVYQLFVKSESRGGIENVRDDGNITNDISLKKEISDFGIQINEGDRITLSIIETTGAVSRVSGSFDLSLFEIDKNTKGVLKAENLGNGDEKFVNLKGTNSNVYWEYNETYSNNEGVNFEDNTVLDLSHESLIGQNRDVELRNVLKTYRSDEFNAYFVNNLNENISINLYLYEPTYLSSGQRIFDVSVNGVVPTEFENIDIYNLSGAKYKVIKISHVSVLSGLITLNISNIVGLAVVAGIEIERI